MEDPKYTLFDIHRWSRCRHISFPQVVEKLLGPLLPIDMHTEEL